MRVIIESDHVIGRIERAVYGHFAEHLGHCVYGGVWVGKDSPIPNVDGIRTDVVEALRRIKAPVIRWPGGCFADEYHWMDGIGDPGTRKRMVNTHWGGLVEDNAFGTHEFLRFCELAGAEPYVNGNLGSGTVREMQEWVEYMTFEGESPMADLRRANGRDEPWKLKYFAVGNENWGCGGNMRPEYYLDEYRRYATYIRNFNGNFIYKVACGPNADDYRWTEVLMSERRSPMMQGLSLHYYTVPGEWSDKGAATGFAEAQWSETLAKALKIEELIAKHDAIMTRYDPKKLVGLVVDEWGTWYAVEPGTNPGFLSQRNTLRDAMVAALTFNAFHAHADRVRMANIAQLANVLQSPLITEGGSLVLTPTYRVFDMYKVHQDSDALFTMCEAPEYSCGGYASPALSASASRDSGGRIHLSVANLDPGKPASVECLLHGVRVAEASGSVITAERMDAENSVAAPEAVAARPFSAFAPIPGGLKAELPPKSIVTLEIR